MKQLCYRFKVTGRVQGVFFRASTRDQAIKLGLSGWVRNLSSGEVELLVYGDREGIDKLGTWLWQGPQFAQVSRVDSKLLPEHNAAVIKGFEIRRDG